MVDTFNPLTVPKVMPASVRRSNEGGFPTQFLLSYEQALQSWMQQNTANINERFNSVESETGDTAAKVENVIQALTDGTGAYGGYITTIDVKANQATAGGEVGFYAAAGPSGSIAAYEIALNAGASLAGMQIIAWSGGGSSIGFYADRFLFVDSGTGVQIVDYVGGVYKLTTNVEIDGNLVVTGTINAGKIESGFSFTGEAQRGDVVTTGTTGTLGVYTDYASVNINPDYDGRLFFIFRHVGTSITTSGAGPVVSSFRVVRRKGGDTVVASWDISEGTDVQTVDFYVDTVGAGSCDYVLQHALTSVAGSATLWTNETSFFRIVVFGADR